MRLRVITRSDGRPYLLRITLLSLPWFSVKLHRFLAPDPQHPHDHPWNFLSILLWGWYNESSEERHAWGRGMFRFRRAEHRHVITPIHGHENVWTLFITFRRRREWFFYLPSGEPVWWMDYLELERMQKVAQTLHQGEDVRAILARSEEGDFDFDEALAFIREKYAPDFGREPS